MYQQIRAIRNYANANHFSEDYAAWRWVGAGLAVKWREYTSNLETKRDTNKKFQSYFRSKVALYLRSSRV